MRFKWLIFACVISVFQTVNAAVSEDYANQKYLFFLHNRFLELADTNTPHFKYGKVEYNEILEKFRNANFNVLSEKRPANTDWVLYSQKICRQIDSLISLGVRPENITVVGTSKGGYIAQLVSTRMNNPSLNFVLIGCFMKADLVDLKQIQLCGNILSIFEETDTLGVPMQDRIQSSGQVVTRFKEIELHTGQEHGFLYHALDDWIEPAVQWAQGNYNVLCKSQIRRGIQTILESDSLFPFQGVVLVQEGDSVLFHEAFGNAVLPSKRPNKTDTRFVIGSISKQMTATLVMQQMEQGKLSLKDTIGKYLPELNQAWKDSVTIYQLLTHTHGITSLQKPLAFRPGSKMDYSSGNDPGYRLLGQILEHVTQKTLKKQMAELFRNCGMENSHWPDQNNDKKLAFGYEVTEPGHVVTEHKTVPNSPAAGGLISNATDLQLWNRKLHGGLLLRPETNELMHSIQPGVIRQHPVWGKTLYGLGMTVDTSAGVLVYGQTGYAIGYASMNYYFPEFKTSVIVFQNVVHETGDFKQRFEFEAKLYSLIREGLKLGK